MKQLKTLYPHELLIKLCIEQIQSYTSFWVTTLSASFIAMVLCLYWAIAIILRAWIWEFHLPYDMGFLNAIVFWLEIANILSILLTLYVYVCLAGLWYQWGET